MNRAAVLLLIVALPGLAQVRTFVSTAGADNASCSRTAPCRTFTAAINAVQAGGEVVVLDSGGYGPVLITKSVSLIAPRGLHASIAATSGDSIRVDTGADDSVSLQNLVITPRGANTGISAGDFKTLFISDCVITGANIGIDVFAPVDGAALFIQDSEVRNSLSVGVRMVSFGGNPVFGTFSGLRVVNSGSHGIAQSPQTRVVCVECKSHGGDVGFRVASSVTPSHRTTLSCDRCSGTSNRIGFESAGGDTGVAEIRLARSTAAFNTQFGVSQIGSGRIFVLDGTNAFTGNATDRNGVMEVVPPDNP